MKIACATSCAAIALASCNQSAIDPSQSLVGAKNLPPAEVLSRQGIYVAQQQYSSRGHLTYELHPDNTLWVRSDHRGSGGIDFEELRVAPDIAERARHDLWRVRPELLQGTAKEVYPIGCLKPRVDAIPDVEIGFLPQSTTLDLSPEDAGWFALPDRTSCRSVAAVEARAMIESVITSFPQSKVAAQYGEGKVFVVVPSQHPHPRQP